MTYITTGDIHTELNTQFRVRYFAVAAQLSRMRRNGEIKAVKKKGPAYLYPPEVLEQVRQHFEASRFRRGVCDCIELVRLLCHECEPEEVARKLDGLLANAKGKAK